MTPPTIAHNADIQAINRRMAELIAPLVEHDGFTSSSLGGLQLIASQCSQPRTPLVYEPSLVIIAQGEKVGYLGDRTIHYGAGTYLVQAMPLPFECETYAEAGTPLLGLSIHIDLVMLGELTELMPAPLQTTPLPMAAVAMDTRMGHSVVHLLECLHDSVMQEALGKGRLREVLFEALRGPQGTSLQQLLFQQGQYARIARALQSLHHHYAAALTVETLAREVNMSPSAFHHHFKQVTCLSPLQYQKRIRLLKARLMITSQHHNVSGAANAVGYQSVSQFSREYKRYFGISPANESRRVPVQAAR
ncbi:AraC family transcriptional regulator [Phytohalomonas tamaricis]|uniref:AraC family transcriptional regulator n=1 Tax=Phytohalomonas tamaricis TaxID=2081032 RepID=UPI000D0AC34E|nr:AraC family transcriptional regulator [Phytohalomonas tamaricis]